MPKEVVSYRVAPLDLPWAVDYVSVLDKAMRSVHMEKAWNAVSRRRAKANPAKFARAILETSYLASFTDKYPTIEEIETHRALAPAIRKLAAKIKRDAAITLEKDWHDFRSDMLLKALFVMPPLEAMEEFACYFDATARDMEETRTSLTAYVGKPGMTDAKRIYVIRRLSEEVRAIYGQPLHDTVALTSGEILGEIVDPELVRKLVKTHKKLEAPYWSG